MSKSLENLMAAFAGESQAYQKYSAFAVQADKEGFKQVAKLFRAAAAAEKVHAGNHLRAAEKVLSTKENLQEAINGETYEFESMYPPMIEDAKAEGNKAAERSFTNRGYVWPYKRVGQRYICSVCYSIPCCEIGAISM